MKKLLIALAMVVGASSQAQTQADGSWLCALTYKGEAKGLQVLFGKFGMQAKGTLRCENSDGSTRNLPVKITAKARRFSAVVAAGYYKVYGASANINLGTKQPEHLLGNYYIAQAQGAIIGGVGVFTGTHVNDSGLTLHISVNAVEGFGFNIGLSRMKIEADDEQPLP